MTIIFSKKIILWQVVGFLERVGGKPDKMTKYAVEQALFLAFIIC
jgi:hypothetical protein